MDTFNDNGMIREEKTGGSSWVWWVIIILIILGLLWFFLGRNTNMNDDQIVDEISELSTDNQIPEGAEFDENGLPILGPDAPISSARIETSESFPVTAALIVTGDLPNGCTYLNSPSQIRRGNTFYVNLSTRQEGEVCTEALVPYERRIPLNVDGLPAGAYIVDINGQQLSFEINQDNTLEFEAGLDK